MPPDASMVLCHYGPTVDPAPPVQKVVVSSAASVSRLRDLVDQALQSPPNPDPGIRAPAVGGGSPGPAVTECPVSYGNLVLARFSAAGQLQLDVVVRMDGCGGITDGVVDRPASDRLRAALICSFPPRGPADSPDGENDTCDSLTRSVDQNMAEKSSSTPYPS